MTDGITATLRFTVRRDKESFFDELPALMAQTMTFPGVRSVRMVRHKDDAFRAMFIDEWDREEDFIAYMDWRTERGDLLMLGEMLEGPMDIDVWPISTPPAA